MSLTPFATLHTFLSTGKAPQSEKEPFQPPLSLSHFNQYRFDDLPIRDTLTRTEHGLTLLDVVIDLLLRASAAEAAYARGLLDTARLTHPQNLRGTGQGVGQCVDSSLTTSGGVAATALSLSGLWGSVAAGAVSAMAGVVGGGGVGPEVGGVGNSLGNGPGSLQSALSALHTSHSKQAAQRQALSHHLNRLHSGLTSLCASHRERTSSLSAKVAGIAKGVSGASKEVEKCQTRVDRARRDLSDAEEQFCSAKEHRGAVVEAELERRRRRVEGCKREVEVALEGVLNAGINASTLRKRGAEELVPIALTLQALEEERTATLQSTLADLAGSALESASAVRSATAELCDAVAAVSIDSDTRTFLHQRRLAKMIGEQTALQDRRGISKIGGIKGVVDDDFLSHAPNPLPRSEAFKNSREFLQDDAVLAPVVVKWVAAIIAGEGGEIMGETGSSLPCPPIPLTIFRAFCAASGSNGGESDAEVALSYPSSSGPFFDVCMLERYAARLSFLRALNLLRSQRHDVGSPAFSRLVRALWWLLDACLAQTDVQSARMAMIMGETFYFSPSGDQVEGKLYVQRILRAHPVWKAEGFWEEQFYASVFEAVKTMSQPYNNSQTHAPSTPPSLLPAVSQGSEDPLTPKAQRSESKVVDGAGFERDPLQSLSPQPLPASYRPGTSDWGYAYEQTIFSQLLAIAHNMCTFGKSYNCSVFYSTPKRIPHPCLPIILPSAHADMPVERTLKTISTLARANGVKEEMMEALRSTILSSSQ